VKKVSKRQGVGVVSAVAIAVALAAAGSSAVAATGHASAHTSAQKPVKIAYLAIGTANTFVDAGISAAQAEAKKLNASITVLDGDFSPATQLSQCQQVASAKQVQAVILFPVSGPALKPCGPLMKSAGLPLVAESQPLGDSVTSLTPDVPGLTANVGDPLENLMSHMVTAAVAACADLHPCNIAWFRTISSLPQGDSVLNKVLTAAIKTHPNMRIVAQADTPLTVQGGYEQMLNFLQKTRDINLLLSYPAQAPVGAIKAIRQQGLTPGVTGKDIRIVASGGTYTETADVRNGTMYATTLELPQSEATQAVEVAVEAARGEKHPDAVNPETDGGLPQIWDAATAKKFPNFKGQWSQ
jgi:ABC-type sugar transport system substrate-binding protein